jgi:hypothetical protein
MSFLNLNHARAVRSVKENAFSTSYRAFIHFFAMSNQYRYPNTTNEEKLDAAII